MRPYLYCIYTCTHHLYIRSSKLRYCYRLALIAPHLSCAYIKPVNVSDCAVYGRWPYTVRLAALDVASDVRAGLGSKASGLGQVIVGQGLVEMRAQPDSKALRGQGSGSGSGPGFVYIKLNILIALV